MSEFNKSTNKVSYCTQIARQYLPKTNTMSIL